MTRDVVTDTMVPPEENGRRVQLHLVYMSSFLGESRREDPKGFVKFRGTEARFLGRVSVVECRVIFGTRLRL